MANIIPVMDETVDGTPRAYISGNCVVVYDEESNAWVSIYSPRNSRGEPTPKAADGVTKAPSFAHMYVF